MFGLTRDPTKAFWQWLAGHRSQIQEELTGPPETRRHRWSVEELGRRLARVDADLVHEIGMPDPSTIELIISADGKKSAFPKVLNLVKSAPPLPGFKVTAFRPRYRDGFQLEIAGQTITDDDLTYRLLSNGDVLGLELFIDRDLDEELRGMVGFLSLDQHLGEYDVATGLQWIEFAAGRPADAQPIAMLAEDFDTWRAMSIH